MPLHRSWIGTVAVVTLLVAACQTTPTTTTTSALTAPIAAADSVASIDGTTIKYDVAGQGDTALVFVHCWTCNRSFWDAQVPYFAPNYKVVRVDLAGHGESGKQRKTYSIPAFGADVAAVVDKLDLKHVILVGHSMGGPVALEAAKRLGDRVIGVVGIDTFYTAFSFPKEKQASNEMAAKFIQPLEENFPANADKLMRSIFAPGADPALVDRIAKNAGAADKAVALSAMRKMFDWYVQDANMAFLNIDGRLRNINGDPKGENKPLHESVVLIAGAGHFPAQEKPTAFNQTLGQIARQLVDNAKK
ncbi:MAG: alpha/beta hydrolase [Gammaproteobacteria bacterium]|nr:alpha/beta hydrolase [Gammaproteobacteria bacterium]